MYTYKIIQLNHHKIFTGCTRNLIRANIANCDFVSFNGTNDAYDHIVNSINNGEIIDVFITDYNHPGMNGYNLSKSIRELENKNNCKPMQILLLTMVSNSVPEIRSGLKEDIFNAYLSILAKDDQILDFVKNHLLCSNAHAHNSN